MLTAKMGLDHGYNCTEMWQRRRLNGRWATIDGMKDRSGVNIERWYGRFIEFGCTSHRRRSTSAQEVQHRISSRLRPRGWDGQSWETSQYTILHNFWYFLPVAQLERLMHCSGGFGPSKCLLSWVIPGCAVNCWVLGRMLQSDYLCWLFNCDT